MKSSDHPQHSKKRKNASISDDSIDPCPICLGPAIRESLLNNCSHAFCFDCIARWAQVVSCKNQRQMASMKCPLCQITSVSILRGLNGDPFQPSSITIPLVLKMEEKDGHYQEFTEGEFSSIAGEITTLGARLKTIQRRWKDFTSSAVCNKDLVKVRSLQNLLVLAPKVIAKVQVFVNRGMQPVQEEAESSATRREVKDKQRFDQAQLRKYWEWVKAWDGEETQSIKWIAAAKPIPGISVLPTNTDMLPASSTLLAREVRALGRELVIFSALRAKIQKWWEYHKEGDEAVARSLQKKARKLVVPIHEEAEEEEEEQGADEEDANEGGEELSPPRKFNDRRGQCQVCGRQLGPVNQ